MAKSQPGFDRERWELLADLVEESRTARGERLAACRRLIALLERHFPSAVN